MLLVFFTKLSFILFVVWYFFLLSRFLVAEDYELSKSRSHLLSVPLTLACVGVRLLSELMILLSIHHLTNHLTCCNKLRWTVNCSLIIKIKIYEKIYIFHLPFFILNCEDLVLKIIDSSSNIKSCYPELVFKKLF